MDFKGYISFILSIGLFINACLFLIQAFHLLREKSAKGVSLITFSGFLFLNILLVIHGYLTNDNVILYGYILSSITNFCIVLLIIRYRFTSKDSIYDISLQEIIDQLPCHVYWKNKDYLLAGCNKSNYKDFSLSSFSDIDGKSDYDLFPKSEADCLREIDKKVLHNGESIVVEEEITPRGKKEKRVYLSFKVPLKNKKNNIVGLAGISVDVTKAKEDVEKKLAILENIIAIMPGNVYWMDKNGIYLGCNDNEAKAVGLDNRRDIVGKKNNDITGFVIPNAIDPVNEKVLSEGITVVAEEPAVLANGVEAVFLSSKVPLRDNKNKIIGLVGVSIDITERKKAEKALVVAKEKAEVASKAKSEFISNISHDIRTPISGMLGMLDIVLNKVNNHEAIEYLTNFKEATQQLLNFLNQILDMSMIDHEKVILEEENINLHDFLYELSGLISSLLFTKSLIYNVNVADDVPENFVVDETKLLRVLLNIIGNAIKFTDKGKVTLSIKLEKNSKGKLHLLFIVTDTGIGIPNDKLDIIFDQFEKLHSSYKGKFKGAGLGLSISQRFIKAMGGRISVKSEEGEGSTFTIQIPLKENILPKGKPSLVSSTQSSFVSNGQTSPLVLVVEDDLFAQQVAEHRLADAGWQVVIVDSGEEAVKQCQKTHFSLILMDVGLPGIDGFETSNLIKKNKQSINHSTPIIALTAHINDEKRSQAQAEGLVKILNKPLNDEQCHYLYRFLTTE